MFLICFVCASARWQNFMLVINKSEEKSFSLLNNEC